MWRMRVACWISRATRACIHACTNTQQYGNSGFLNAPECHVVRRLPVLKFARLRKLFRWADETSVFCDPYYFQHNLYFRRIRKIVKSDY